MTIKLIACDMDGTLLDSRRHISGRTQKAIQAVIDKGIIFIIATGRMYPAAKPFAEQLGLDIPMVTFNGALIRGSRSGEIFLEQPIKLSTAQELLDYIKVTGHYANFYVGDTLYIKEHNDYSQAYGKMQGVTTCIEALGDDFYKAVGRPYKILLMMEPEETKTAFAEFQQRFAGKLDVTQSHPMFLELMEPGVNKWQAILTLAGKYGIKPEEIMCFGDSRNDLEMVAKAGCGVAVGNAVDELKQAAKIITGTNDEDGVAQVLESLLQ